MNRAFTLVEILLVVLILAIVASSAVPSFQRSYAAQRLSSATDDIVYLMRYARSRAITEAAYLQMIFEGRRIGLVVAPVEADGDPGTFEPVTGAIGRRVVVPGGLELLEPPANVLFYPDGRIEPVSFSLANETGRFTISTQEMPGHVLVREE